MYIKYLTYEFDSKSSFALYLKDNFQDNIENIFNQKIYQCLEIYDDNLLETLVQYSKNYQKNENILTLLIYIMDSNLGIVTKDNIFHDFKDMTNVMKNNYPNILYDIDYLLEDGTLSDICDYAYNLTKDNYYNRYKLFFEHVKQYHPYQFTYYYFLFFHLNKGENIRFSFDNLKMDNIEDVSTYLLNHRAKLYYLLEEIKKNMVILALIAKHNSLESMVRGLSESAIYLLKPLSFDDKYDFKTIIEKEFPYWLVNNYDRYQFKNKYAKYIEHEFILLNKDIDNYANYLDVFVASCQLYKDFINLYNDKSIIYYQNGIEPYLEEDDLKYQDGDYYVSKRFLMEINRFDYEIHTTIYQRNVSKKLICDQIEIELNELKDIEDNLKDEKRYRSKTYIVGFVLSFLLIIPDIFLWYVFYEKKFLNYLFKFLPLFLFLLMFVFGVLIHICHQKNYYLNCYSLSKNKYEKIINNILSDEKIDVKFLHKMFKRRKKHQKYYHKILVSRGFSN